MAAREVRLSRLAGVVALVFALAAGAIAVSMLVGALAAGWAPLMIVLLTLTVAALVVTVRYARPAATSSHQHRV